MFWGLFPHAALRACPRQPALAAPRAPGYALGPGAAKGHRHHRRRRHLGKDPSPPARLPGDRTVLRRLPTRADCPRPPQHRPRAAARCRGTPEGPGPGPVRPTPPRRSPPSDTTTVCRRTRPRRCPGPPRPPRRGRRQRGGRGQRPPWRARAPGPGSARCSAARRCRHRPCGPPPAASHWAASAGQLAGAQQQLVCGLVYSYSAQ